MTYAILFFLRKEKTNKKSGLSPIYLRISAGSQRTEISTNKWVPADKWNAATQKVTGNNPEHRAINDFLNTIRVKFHQIHTTLLEKGTPVSASILKNAFTGKSITPKSLVGAFEFHLNINASTYKTSTANKYKYCLDHLKSFIWLKYREKDLPLHRIDPLFITEFRLFLQSETYSQHPDRPVILKQANGHNSSTKYLKMLKTITNEAMRYKWISEDPFVGTSLAFRQTEQVSLSTKELIKLKSQHFDIARLEIAKDVFLFSCFTGLAYADVSKLSPNHLITNIDGKRWIHVHRTKTNTECRIPLLPDAEAIIKKYRDDIICRHKNKLLPVYSNQKSNAYLKEIASICGLDKNLTTHVARRTFATIAIENGVPAESVIKLIGHKSFKYLHLYAKHEEHKIASDIENFNLSLSSINKSN